MKTAATLAALATTALVLTGAWADAGVAALITFTFTHQAWRHR